jgi:hypothetical protein
MSEEIVEENLFVPKKVFIVPYRNRPQHKFFFSKYMTFILEGQNDYEIFFSHQCDARTFNRGATKNIGFLAVKEKYPEHYKNIIFVFNDVDTIPFNNIFDYETTHGIVKHYYGYKYALGGIVVMTGADFEKVNGYPCYWGWGMEDNSLQKRCEYYNIKIDRNTFYNIGSPQILQLFDGISRIISKKDPWRMESDNGIDGLRTITKLKYTIDEKSANPNDNIFVVNNPKIFIINIHSFLTNVRFETDQYYKYDLREPKRKIINPDSISLARNVVGSTDDWSKIPYYPTVKERRENMAKTIISNGKLVPQDLLNQIAIDKIKELQSDSFNKDIQDNSQREEEDPPAQPPHHPYAHHPQHPHLQQQPAQHPHQQYSQQQQYAQRHHQQYQYPQQYTQHPPHPPTNINKYAVEYANYIGQKPRATASARIKLGGVY